MIDNLSIIVHTFAMRILTSLSIDEIFLPKYVKLSTNSRGLLAWAGVFARSAMSYAYVVCALFFCCFFFVCKGFFFH